MQTRCKSVAGGQSEGETAKEKCEVKIPVSHPISHLLGSTEAERLQCSGPSKEGLWHDRNEEGTETSVWLCLCVYVCCFL